MSKNLIVGLAALALLGALAVFRRIQEPGGHGLVESPAAAADPKDPPSAGAQANKKAAAAKALFAGWDKPAIAILVSGEMHGYVEPCGCSLDQLGGLARRADLLRQISDRRWPVTALDVGGLVNNPTRQQAKFKFDMALKSLADMRYAGVAMGLEELQLSFDFLARPAEPPFLCSNVVLFGDATIAGGPVPFRVVKVGGIKVGVTAVFGPSLKDEVVPGAQEGAPKDFEVLEPVASLKKALAALKAEKPDLLILLSHARFDETKKIAANFPQFDIVISAGGPEDPDPRPKFLGEKTLLVAPGQKGKHVPVVGWYPKAAKDRLKYELVDLDDKRFRDAPQIVEHMRFYQELLKERNLVAREPDIDDPRPTPRLDANPFVGAKVCGECHKSALEVWETTKHAHATETLKTGRPGDKKPWIDRLYDPECVACHVTGWDPKKIVGYKTGYKGEQATPHLLGQQCENCHGPGGRHTELERLLAKNKGKAADDEVAAWRKYHRLSKKTAFDLCVKCHDGDNDPHFKTETFDSYWEQIAHPGKD
jgi:hypothetical protein